MKCLQILNNFNMLDELDLYDYLSVAEKPLTPLNSTERITKLNKLFGYIYKSYYPPIRFHNSVDQEKFIKEFYQSKYAIPYSTLKSLLEDCDLTFFNLSTLKYHRD